MEAISATGQVIPVFLILSGTMHMANWYRLEELDKDTVIGTSPTGYSNNELSMAWIQHFEACTRKGTIGSKSRLATVWSGPDCGLFWRLFKKTGPYGPAPPDCSSVPKILDRTVQSS